MRSTTLFSLLAAGLALLSQSPAAYAAPVPSRVNSVGEKRGCFYTGCKIAEVPSTSNTATTPQSPVLDLVDTLISALEEFRNHNTFSGPTVSTDLATPTNPEVDDTTTTDGSPTVDTVELAGHAL